jgi:autotransporter-associated beta strand protein
MSFFYFKQEIRMISCLVGLVVILLATGPAYPATYTWDGEGGDGNPALDAAVNWNPDGVPPFSASASDTYLFAGASPTVPIVVPAGGVGMRNMTFDPGTAFTFGAADPVADAITMGSTGSNMTLTNNSESAQTFDVQVAPYRGSIMAASGDIVFNGLVNVGAGAQSSYVKFYGDHDIHIQGENGGLVGMGLIGTNYSAGGNFVVGNTSGALAGRVYIDVDSPISPLNENGGRWNGMAFIYNSNLRISTPYALGEGGETGGYTLIRSGDSQGGLELVNNITVNEKLRLDGRNSETAVHVVNISEDNTLTGPLYNTMGIHVGLQSDAGLLTIQGDLTVTATAAADRFLNLRGASNARMEGKIDASDGFVTLSLNKYDGGTWILTNANNDYTGATTISGGTLALEGSGAIASTPSIDVQNGATLDVSGLSSAFTLGGTQTLKGSGSIVGSVVTAAGSSIEPGESTGMLTVDGDLDMSADDAGTGAGMTWELAALVDDATPGTPGTDYDLTVVTGNLQLGGASQLTLDFNLLDASLRPDAAIPDSFWLAPHSWKIINTNTNTGDTNFAGLAPVTTPAGWSFITSVGEGENAGDVYLHYVPEPSSLVLLIAAFATMSLMVYRRRQG